MKTKIGFVQIIFVFLSIALPTITQGVIPAPDGAYPGGNTAEGQNALFSLTTGADNTAVGFYSLLSDRVGGYNTAVGAGTLPFNTADANTATGALALLSNTTGRLNTATGAVALEGNTTGDENTAIGVNALQYNTTGSSNTAAGVDALAYNTTGNVNTALGYQALEHNIAAFNNTAVGVFALNQSTSGGDNVAVGARALYHVSTGGGNTAIGEDAGSEVSTASHVICIGSGIGGANVNSTCFIGNIRGTTTIANDAVPVMIASNHQLGTMSSSARFKKDIKPMDTASEAILALKPVTFHYKSDAKSRPEFGLIAEQVAEVNPDLVVRDEKGQIYTVRYDAVNAMLLNEFLKEHRKVEEQQAAIARQRHDFETTVAALKQQLQALMARAEQQDSEIQHVNRQVQMSKADIHLAATEQR